MTETLDSVQKRVEGYYRNIRAQLFNYDFVCAGQRRQLYKLRRSILEADSEQIFNLMLEQGDVTAAGVVAEANKAAGGKEAPDAPATVAKLAQFFGGPAFLKLSPAELAKGGGRGGELSAEAAAAAGRAALGAKAAALDAKRPGLAAATARYLLLVQLDTLWKQHMADVRTVQDMVGLRSLASQDPLIEFREEATVLYQRMLKVAAYNSVFSFGSYSP